MTDVVVVVGRYGVDREQIEQAVQRAQRERRRMAVVVATGGWHPEAVSVIGVACAPLVVADDHHGVAQAVLRTIPADIPVTVRVERCSARAARRRWGVARCSRRWWSAVFQQPQVESVE